MKAFLMFLFSAAAAFAQTEKWSYTIPGIPGITVDQVEIRQLRHDAAGNVGLVIRYQIGAEDGDQVRWIGANGKEFGVTVPEGSNIRIISVSPSALLFTHTNPSTFEVTLEKLTRKGAQSVSKPTKFGTADVEVMGLADPAESPTQNTFFIQQRNSATDVMIKRFSVR